MSEATRKEKHERVRADVAAELRRLAWTLDGSLAATVSNRIFVSTKAFLKAAFRRLLIWLLSLCVAFYVPIHEVGVPYYQQDWEAKVVAAGKTNDVFLAIVAMVILSATDLLDMLLGERSPRADAVTKGSAALLLACYFLFIFFQMATLGTVDPLGAASVPQSSVANPNWGLFTLMLAFGVVGELLIAKTAS